ncbi:MAG: hypothetical protein ACLRZ6_01120 [Lachnospiraceae bacterium]
MLVRDAQYCFSHDEAFYYRSLTDREPFVRLSLATTMPSAYKDGVNGIYDKAGIIGHREGARNNDGNMIPMCDLVSNDL